jgi:hypothetical protein
VDKKQKQRTIIFYKKYFEEFFVQQRDKVKEKVIWTFDLIEEVSRVQETYLKHIENTDGLFETGYSKVVIFSESFVFSTRDI